MEEIKRRLIELGFVLTIEQFIELTKEEMKLAYGIWTGDMEGGDLERTLYFNREKALAIAGKIVEEKNSFWLNHIHSKGTDEEDYKGVIFKQVSETVWTTGDSRIEVKEFEIE